MQHAAKYSPEKLKYFSMVFSLAFLGVAVANFFFSPFFDGKLFIYVVYSLLLLAFVFAKDEQKEKVMTRRRWGWKKS